MNYRPAYTRTMRALGILMLFYCLLLASTLSSIIQSEGLNIYGVAWIIIVSCYGVIGAYLLFARKKSIVVCITLVLVVQAVTAGFNYLATLSSTDDIQFAKTVVSLIIVLLDLILLVLYLMGFRRSSRRLILLLGVQAYVMLLELMVAFHFSREIVNTIFMNFQVFYNLLVYLMLIFLLDHRSVSDLPIKRMTRFNSERLYTSLCCGMTITISEEDYALLSSDDRSSWNQSVDPDVEAETSIPARDRYGKYGILVQKRRGHDNIRLVFHDAVSVGYLDTVTVDVSHIVEMESVYDCRKIRFYGKEGMFIDLLVGDFEAVMRSSQSF